AAMAEAEALYWEAERSAREAAGSREVTREAVIRLESRGEALDARVSDLQARSSSARAELNALGPEERLRTEPAEDREPATALDAAVDAAQAAERAWQGAADASAEADAELVAAEDALAERAERSGAIGERLVASGWRSLVDAVRAPDAAWPAVEAVIGGELSEALLWRDADPGSATADARGTVRLLDGRRPPEAPERH